MFNTAEHRAFIHFYLEANGKRIALLYSCARQSPTEATMWENLAYIVGLGTMIFIVATMILAISKLVG